MNTVTTPDTQSASTTLDTRIAALRAEMKLLNAQRTAALPRLTNTERELVVASEREVELSEEAAIAASELRKNRRFSEEDRDQVQAARLEHKRLVNSPALKQEAVEMIAKSYLSSYKLVHRKDGRIGISIRGQI